MTKGLMANPDYETMSAEKTEVSELIFTGEQKASSESLVKDTLSASVEATLTRYFDMLNGFESAGVYEMVMNEVEAPLLRVVLAYCENNQSRAAEVLGLNRGTLRKKLKLHNLL